jgi:thiosulfate oxidation carrier complex protein SoxZ
MVMTVADRMRVKLKFGNTYVRILLAHPMRSGKGVDVLGEPIPQKFIQDIRCWRNEDEVLAIKCGIATSTNPYFAFQLAGGQKGDKISVRWVDNTGAKGQVKTLVP